MKGANNKDLSCGNGSKPGKLMANINPGDEISFSWVEEDGSHVSLHSWCCCCICIDLRRSGYTKSVL